MALVLRESDVQRILSSSMPDVVTWTEDAFRNLGNGQARCLPRQRVKLKKGRLHVLPAGDQALGAAGAKVYSTFGGASRFVTLLFSADTGALLALVESKYLGMMRTGAASAVATRYMAAPHASVLAIFGSEFQARGQVLAVAAVRPLQEIRVFSREAAHREQFAAEISPLVTARVVAVASAAEALDGAHIVCTATSSATPVFDGGLVAPGTHVNAVGSNALLRRELDPALFRRAGLVVVDSRAQAPLECGDLLVPVEQGLFTWDTLPELGDLVSGRLAWQRGEGEITIFESQGIGLEDVAVAWHVYHRARSLGLGQEVELLG